MIQLLFAGQLTCQAQTIPVEFTFEVDPAQLLAILESLLGQPGPGLAEPVAGFEPDPELHHTFTREQPGRPSLPLEIAPHPGRDITSDDLTNTNKPAQRWAMLGYRFPWLFQEDQVTTRPPSTLKDIKRLERGDESAALPAPDPVANQLSQDLAAVRPHLKKIIQAGQFVRGHQSRIAEALGITNGGASNRRRIKRIERFLARKIAGKKNSSSSSPAEHPAQRSTDQSQAA
jgi:hypothetical protein